MNKIIFAVVAMLAFAGCSALPSFEYCDEVHYDRIGNKIKASANCTVPLGSGNSPIPLLFGR